MDRTANIATVYRLTVVLFLSLSLLLAITLAIARREPIPLVNDPMGYRIGDVIVAWGTPDSIEYEGIHLIELEFNGIDVMDCREPFTPVDVVCFSFQDDDAHNERLKGTQWKGFRQKP